MLREMTALSFCSSLNKAEKKENIIIIKCRIKEL